MNFGKMMKQVQQAQAKMAEVQEQLKDVTVEASSGGGMVRVVVSGDLQVKSIDIDPSAIDPDDVELIGDMVTAAVNEALRSAQETAASMMAKVTGGMNLPGMM